MEANSVQDDESKLNQLRSSKNSRRYRGMGGQKVLNELMPCQNRLMLMNRFVGYTQKAVGNKGCSSTAPD